MPTRLIIVFLACLIPLAPHTPANAQDAYPIVEELSFPGGTLGEYVVILRAAVEPEPVNIILRGTATEIEVPEINIQMVAVPTAIEIALPDPFEEHMVFDDDGQMHRVIRRFDTYGYGEPGSLVIVIEETSDVPGTKPSGRAGAGQRDTHLEVFALAELVALSKAGGAPTDVDTIVSAVEATLDISADDGTDIRYHEESTLLIVRGSQSQVYAVEQVLDRFYEIAESAASMERARRVLAVAERMVVIKLDADGIEDKVHRLRRKIDELESQQDDYRMLELTKPPHYDAETLAEMKKDTEIRLVELQHRYEDVRHQYAGFGAQVSKLRAMQEMLREPKRFSDAAALAATDEFATEPTGAR